MSRLIVGDKYEATKCLSAVAIAKMVRQDIKAAVAACELPQGVYRVRSGRATYTATIDVTFAAPPPFALFNRARMEWEAAHPHECSAHAPESARPRYSLEARMVIAKLEAIVGAYNREESDFASDYLSTRFFARVEPDPAWSVARRAAETRPAKEVA